MWRIDTIFWVKASNGHPQFADGRSEFGAQSDRPGDTNPSEATGWEDYSFLELFVHRIFRPGTKRPHTQDYTTYLTRV